MVSHCPTICAIPFSDEADAPISLCLRSALALAAGNGTLDRAPVLPPPPIGGSDGASEASSSSGSAPASGAKPGDDWRCPECGHFNFSAAAGASGTGAGAQGRTTCLKCVAQRPPVDFNPPPFTRLCVSHDGAASISDLTDWFSVYGRLKCLPNGPPHIKSFTFLEYFDPAHALQAQKCESGRRLPGGRLLVVMPATERQERGGGGGGRSRR